ncbi:MAG: hypothetical protein ACI4OE_05580, partial [Alphaproteobacteria bacterium]
KYTILFLFSIVRFLFLIYTIPPFLIYCFTFLVCFVKVISESATALLGRQKPFYKISRLQTTLNMFADFRWTDVG